MSPEKKLYVISDRVGACGHSMAYQYFARSILRTMPELYGCACGPPDGNFLVASSTCAEATGACEEPTLFGQYVRRTYELTLYKSFPWLIFADPLFSVLLIEQEANSTSTSPKTYRVSELYLSRNKSRVIQSEIKTFIEISLKLAVCTVTLEWSSFILCIYSSASLYVTVCTYQCAFC